MYCILDNVEHVSLSKGSSGLGFSVIGGQGSHPDPIRCVTRVKKVFQIGPAADSGRIKVGDVLLKVNGVKVKDMTHNEVVTLLRMSPREVTLVLCRPTEGTLPPIEDLEPDSPYYDADLQRNLLAPDGMSSATVETSDHEEETQLRSPDHQFESSSPSQNMPSVIRRVRPPSPKQKTRAFIEYEPAPHHNVRPTQESPSPQPRSSVSDFGGESGLDKETEEETEEEEGNSIVIAKSVSRSVSVDRIPEIVRMVEPPPNIEKPKRVSARIQETPTPVRNFNASAGLMSTDPTPNPEHPENRGSVDGEEDQESHSEEDTLKHGEYLVTMTKGDRGLGFTVAGGSQNKGFFYVKDILYEPALSDGRINPGDRLMRVNSVDMTGMTHKEAVGYLRQTPATVTIRFYRPSISSSGSGGSRSTPSQPSNKTEEEPYGKEIQTIQQAHNTPHGRAHTPDEHLKSTASSWGDPPIPDDLDADVEIQRINKDNSRDSQSTAVGVMRFEVIKPADGKLGLSLVQGERKGTTTLHINNITPGSIIDNDGQLHVGDRLLQVNDESVIGMPHNKAIEMIRSAQNKISFTIQRVISQSNTPVGGRPRSAPRPPSHPPPDPPRSIQEDTDSDVDSSAFDDDEDNDLENTQGRSASYEVAEAERSYQNASPASDAEEDARTFDSLSEGHRYHKMVYHDRDTGAEHSDTDPEEDESWGEGPSQISFPNTSPRNVPKEANYKHKDIRAKFPDELTDEWLDSLTLVDPPETSLHYSGRQLLSAIKSLRAKIMNDEPMEEYKTLRHAKLTDNCNEARKPENKVKNRFRNVLPYDATRVYLEGEDDYINASHVRMGVGKESLHYIACQGPMASTTGDFWRMIWEQNVDVIAMLTLDMEGGKMKCHRYWPDSVNTPFTIYNRYEVSLQQVYTLEHFDVHMIRLEDLESGEMHSITHLNFTTWPDQGCPESAVPLIQYMKFLHMVHQAGPIAVHCSAGIGRTGAYITLDVISEYIKRDMKFDIYKIVNDLRRQRQGMIQTKDQYNFCYKAVLEGLESLTDD